MTYEKRQLPKKSENLSDWYNAVVQLAEIADYGPAKGTMIIRPWGYTIWERLQEYMDRKFKASGVVNAYFPLFIPMSLFNKEKEHVEGFAPELAVVTHGGGEELGEKLAVRPTSETIMYESYAKWIKSWRDLPMEINQWNNVVRWEKRTYLFLRTSEFLWQEGHCAHATHEESWDRVVWAAKMYEQTYRELYALPGILGRKSESEKFAGADVTLTFETLMPEGKALQACTSHDLGQNFARAQDIKFQDKTGQAQYVWQNSWGFSTRSVGGLLMAHGDDAGLVLPPAVAGVQVIVIPVNNDENLAKYANEVKTQLDEAGIRVKVDAREGESLGFRINKWELKGVPVRIEIGNKEVEAGELTVVRRDNGAKCKVQSAKCKIEIKKLLDEIQKDLLERQEKFLAEHTHTVDDYTEFKRIMEGERGFVRALWCEGRECEAKVKEETKATTRCLPLDAQDEVGKCIYCGGEAKHRWIWGVAY